MTVNTILPLSSVTTSTSTTSIINSTYNTCTFTDAAMILAHREAAFFALDDSAVNQYIQVSRQFDYNCPDGTRLRFEDGNVTIYDENAKVIYKSNPIREFNPYLNASDLLEEFIAYCKKKKVRQSDFMQLPVELFIMWLVVRTAEKDG